MVTIRTFADPAEQAFAEDCVRALRKEVDFLCLSLHWGYGGLSSKIAEYQPPLGHGMIDAGADIILGNHVHAVQGVEQYRGQMSPHGFLSFVHVDESGDYELRMIPTTLDSRGLPVLASGEPLDRIATRIIDWSAKLETKVQLVGGELRVAA